MAVIPPATMDDLIAQLQRLAQRDADTADVLHAAAEALAEQRRYTRRLESLLEINTQLNATLDYDALLRVILDRACELLDAEAASIFLLDRETGECRMALATTIAPELAGTIRVPCGAGIVGEVVRTGATVLVTDARTDPRHYGGADAISGLVTEGILCVPLRTHDVSLGAEGMPLLEAGRIIGAAEVINKRSGAFTAQDVAVFEALAGQAAAALETSSLYRDLQHTFLGVVSALAASIDAKDDYTHGHSARVAAVSLAIGRALGLGVRELSTLRLGATLHDVGKIGVPDEVLNKPGSLTTEEMAVLRTHTDIGFRIMSRVPALEAAARAMHEHHERYDGQGYPRGLAGDAIAFAARIIAVADAYDAMTSSRVYRFAMSEDEAIRRIRAGAGSQFDPTVVDGLLRALAQGALPAYAGV